MKTKSNGLILSKRLPGFSPFTRFDFPGGLFTLFLRGIMETWVKFYRKSIENGWLKNPKLWTFWSYCLLKASHTKHKTIVGYQEVILESGQFIFGRKKAAKELKMSEQSIRSCLNNLRKMENITIKTTNKYSVITVVNWSIYNQSQNETNHQANQQVTIKQPTSNQQVTTNKNVKNGKNEKKEKRSREKFSPPCIETLTMEFQSKGITGEAGRREAELFFNFYDSKNWYVGKSKMVRWKSAVAGWVARNKEKNQKPKQKDSMTQQVDDMEDCFEQEE